MDPTTGKTERRVVFTTNILLNLTAIYGEDKKDEAGSEPKALILNVKVDRIEERKG
jgi:hypothetical protein